ncbi:MAG TPA: hypothetical protein EYP07_17140 [Kiloniellaceae bacterium]|nr:hypothetical protein [Kiloniellaceae bacterium]
MIKRGDMFEPILEACPGFVPTWRAFCVEWAGEGERPEYLALADLARYLIAMLEQEKLSELKAVFEVVERWHLEGEPYVKEAATIGLLENLQNENLHNTTSPDDFLRFLLPESRFWWDKVVAFWETGQIIVDDR